MTKEIILATDPKLEEIEVREWGGSVFIRRLPLADSGTRFEKAPLIGRMKNITLRLVQRKCRE